MLTTVNRVELPFQYQGHHLTMVFDMMTVARFETESGISMLSLLADLSPLSEDEIAAGAPPKAPPKMTHLGFLMQAALTEKHPDITLQEAMTMLTVPDIAQLFTKGTSQSMPQQGDTDASTGEAGEASGANPPNRRARRASTSKSRSAGKTG